MMWMESLRFKNCIFEIDSKLLAAACNVNHEKSDFHAIVANRIESFKHFDYVRVQFVYKSANRVAYTLARVFHFMPGLPEWKRNIVEFIIDVLYSNMI